MILLHRGRAQIHYIIFFFFKMEFFHVFPSLLPNAITLTTYYYYYYYYYTLYGWASFSRVLCVYKRLKTCCERLFIPFSPLKQLTLLPGISLNIHWVSNPLYRYWQNPRTCLPVCTFFVDQSRVCVCRENCPRIIRGACKDEK
jgi:hypothetical protein